MKKEIITNKINKNFRRFCCSLCAFAAFSRLFRCRSRRSVVRNIFIDALAVFGKRKQRRSRNHCANSLSTEAKETKKKETKSFKSLEQWTCWKRQTKQIIVTGFPVCVFIPTRQILDHYTITYQAFDVPLAPFMLYLVEYTICFCLFSNNRY